VEVVTVSLEMSGPEASRPFIEAAAAEHPSLLDPLHKLDAMFGVVNIPSVTWINEDGVIVRPPEPGWPGPTPDGAIQRLRASLPTLGRAPHAPTPREGSGQRNFLAGGQDRAGYPDKIRDWVEKGAASPFARSIDEVVARSQPRPPEVSQAAAHFELATHLWTTGRHDLAITHFNQAHRLQPDNWTYKRQAYSAVGNERHGGEYGRFIQSPLPGEEEDWPFESDFYSEVATLEEGEYYPNTIS
jgi:hypothetical protein